MAVALGRVRVRSVGTFKTVRPLCFRFAFTFVSSFAFLFIFLRIFSARLLRYRRLAPVSAFETYCSQRNHRSVAFTHQRIDDAGAVTIVGEFCGFLWLQSGICFGHRMSRAFIPTHTYCHSHDYAQL